MLFIRVGKPGEGKSLTASMDIRERLDRGVTIYTNLHLNETRENYHYFDTKDYQVIFDMQDGEIWFDEGQQLLDARQWEKLPVEFKFLLQKGRHEGLDFYILTQNINQIDVLARRLLHEGDFVYRLFSWKRFQFGIFFLWDLDLQKPEDQKVKMGYPTVRIATKDDWAYYDSYALRTKKAKRPKTMCACGVAHQLELSTPLLPLDAELSSTSQQTPLASVPAPDDAPAQPAPAHDVRGVEASEGGKVLLASRLTPPRRVGLARAIPVMRG